MSQFNLNTNHPIIPNSNQYFFEKKYVTIHSSDRDLTKFPNSSSFEIELPQDYLNVHSAKLYSWTFPANYSVFSSDNSNNFLIFKFVKLYNPGEFSVSDPLNEAIFAALYSNINTPYVFTIEPGFYNPQQMATELTNKINEIITVYLKNFFADPKNNEYNYAAALFVSYNRFKVVYNEVSQNLWFGNNADQFVLLNTSLLYIQRKIITNRQCSDFNADEFPNFTVFGLPTLLGFIRVDVIAFSGAQYVAKGGDSTNVSSMANGFVPRFYYGDVTTTGDDGYWIKPTLPGAVVYYLQAPFKINFIGPSYIYMEIDGFNCIDETIPFTPSVYENHNSGTNGVVNSAFAKLAIPTTPISQWFDANDGGPYKYFNPPAERIRKLKIKFRYHNNLLVNFNSFEISFMIEFCLLRPQNERKYNIREAFNLYQIQGT